MELLYHRPPVNVGISLAGKGEAKRGDLQGRGALLTPYHHDHVLEYRLVLSEGRSQTFARRQFFVLCASRLCKPHIDVGRHRFGFYQTTDTTHRFISL